MPEGRLGLTQSTPLVCQVGFEGRGGCAGVWAPNKPNGSSEVVEINSCEMFCDVTLVLVQGHPQIIEVLHKNGAVLNIETKFEKRTALHIAASVGSVEAAETLVELGAKVNKADIYGSTPLHAASMAGKSAVLSNRCPFIQRVQVFVAGGKSFFFLKDRQVMRRETW